MSFLMVESYDSDRLTIHLPNGTFAGEGIINLMGGLVLYCKNEADLGEKEKLFFRSLAEKWRGNICVELCDTYYDHAYYNGKGLRTESERLVYTEIDNCIVQLEKLQNIFRDESYESNVWYAASRTEAEIQAFVSTLNTLKARNAQTARFILMI